MERNYETIQRKIYDSSLDLAKIMGDREKTSDIFTVQRRLLANRLIWVEGEPSIPDHGEYYILSRKLEKEYNEKFNQLKQEQEKKQE